MLASDSEIQVSENAILAKRAGQPGVDRLVGLGVLDEPAQAQPKLELIRGGARPEGDFTFIDLFAGIGGLRRGFESIGGRCVFTSEWDKYSQKTYRANFPDDDHEINGDITKIEAADIPAHDVLLAGFPCQPFSIAGVSKKNSLNRPHGFEDKTQGTLFYDVARIIRHHRPAAFFLENVRNLVSHDKGRTFQTIKDVLENDPTTPAPDSDPVALRKQAMTDMARALAAGRTAEAERLGRLILTLDKMSGRTGGGDDDPDYTEFERNGVSFIDPAEPHDSPRRKAWRAFAKDMTRKDILKGEDYASKLMPLIEKVAVGMLGDRSTAPAVFSRAVFRWRAETFGPELARSDFEHMRAGRWDKGIFNEDGSIIEGWDLISRRHPDFK